MKYYKQNGTEITERIENGLTKFFSCEFKNYIETAKTFASQTRTYSYKLYSYTGKCDILEFIGLGVPK